MRVMFYWEDNIFRASKSPDFAGDLPIFDKIMKITRSPDLEWKSPDFFTRDYASTVDRQFCNSSRRNDFQVGKFCLKPFANCVVIEKKNSVYGCRPRKTPYSSGHSPHASEREAWLLRCAWPSLGLIRSLATKASEEEGFPEIRHCCTFYRLFVQWPIMLQNKWRDLKGNYWVGANTSV